MTAGKVSLMLRMRLFCSLHQPNGKRITVDGKEVGKCYYSHIHAYIYIFIFIFLFQKKLLISIKFKGDRQVMNEVSLHRGRYPHLTAIGCYVDGEYLTECVVC